MIKKNWILFKNSLLGNLQFVFWKLTAVVRIYNFWKQLISNLCQSNEKQKQIMDLIPDIRKYFSFNNLKAVGEPERIKRPWLSIIKQLTKKHYTLTNKHYRIYKDDGKVIRTMNYTFTKIHKI